ncbi:MAG: PilZ domain-containing protein [Gammaproteobacteria bacterium]|nr:PilZ domain-containing protein [Gammaproteobacteria bacterium]
MEDKRRFHRIFFSTPVSIQVGGKLYSSELIDLSLNGALIKQTGSLALKSNDVCNLNFKLENSEVYIDMTGVVAHVEPNTVGIQLDKIDIESVSHLKRLITLNIGDEELLHRDLENLGDVDN